MKKKAVFITNIPSPYRVDFFSYMQKNFPEYEFHIIFSGAGMENRKWSVEMEEIEHYHFLKSKTIIIRKRFDDRYVFIPVGVEKTLNEIAPDVVFAMDAIVDPVSLYEPIYDSGGDAICVMDQVSDTKNTDERWTERIALKDAMKLLDPRERRILSLRFYEGKTQMEVSAEVGISQAQVSRLEKGAINTIRKHL